MRILHLMGAEEKFTKGVAGFYNEFFSNENHDICYVANSNTKSFIDNNLTISQFEIVVSGTITQKIVGCIELIKMIKKYDYVVLHSFFLNKLIIYYLFLHKKICQSKIIWIEWGADLYDFKLQNNPSLKNRLGFHIRSSVRSNVNSIICIFPPDCNVVKEKFPKSNANIFYAPYISTKPTGIKQEYTFESMLNKTKNSKEPVYIQVGHNGQKQLNHIEVLNSLRKFSDENIMLFLPLNYCADKEYYEAIINFLDKYFKDKYIVLKEFMKKEDYYKLLRRVDIAIFHSYRQTGLYNIYELMRNNVKLFMPKGSVMYDYFINKGLFVGDSSSIENIDYQKLTSELSSDDIRQTHLFLGELDDFYKGLKYWKNIYEGLRNSNEK